MFSCHKLKLLLVLSLVLVLKNHQSWAKPVAEAAAEPNVKSAVKNLSELLLITDDVIPDKVEKDNKKVIRVNPLDLPVIQEDPNVLNMDSSLYNIQSLKPYNGNRRYINMRRTKPQIEVREPLNLPTDTPIIRGFSLLDTPQKSLKPKHQPKKKQLHFLYNQEDLGGNLLSKTMQVHVASGAYPVYYVLAKTNGRFGKYPLKSFDSPQAFRKYLKKNKLEDLTIMEMYNEDEV